MTIKYTKAPISTLSFGLLLKTNTLIRNSILFDVIIKLQQSYPILRTTPYSPNEEIENGNISVTEDFAASGFSTYILCSSDLIYQIDLQQNSVVFSWNRRDDMPTASGYPGFESVYSLFKSVFGEITTLALSRGVDLKQEIRLYNLKYADRVNLKTYTDRELKLDAILKLNNPHITIEGKNYIANNCISKYSIYLPYLNGYSIVSINTPTYPNPALGQLLLLDNKVEGYNGDMEYWFEEAHKSQISFFENIFHENILNDWR